MGENKNTIKTKTEKVNTIIYDKSNILEVIKLLDTIKVIGIEQCAIMTTIAQRLNSFIKEEEIKVEI